MCINEIIFLIWFYFLLLSMVCYCLFTMTANIGIVEYTNIDFLLVKKVVSLIFNQLNRFSHDFFAGQSCDNSWRNHDP